MTFLSTLSLRRATNGYPHTRQRGAISIHALLAESDQTAYFLFSGKTISIHALLAESDGGQSCNSTLVQNFYPRSPCGDRPYTRTQSTSLSAFLSTLSLRRATSMPQMKRRGNVFLSTLSLRRATAKVHKTVGHFCAYETTFMGIASSC